MRPLHKAILFILITFAFSLVLTDDFGMFVPGATALALCLFFRDRFWGMFKPASLKTIVLSCLIPLLGFGLFVGFLMVFDLAILGVDEEALKYNEGSTYLALKRYFLYGFPTFLLINCGFALGEEIGWRGYMLPRFQEMGLTFTKRALIVGLIWGLWHIPTYITLGIGLPMILCFLLNVVILSFFFTWAYEREQSIWGPTLIHGLHNALFNTFLPNITLAKNAPEILIDGENGLLATAAYGLLMILLFRIKGPKKAL